MSEVIEFYDNVTLVEYLWGAISPILLLIKDSDFVCPYMLRKQTSFAYSICKIWIIIHEVNIYWCSQIKSLYYKSRCFWEN